MTAYRVYRQDDPIPSGRGMKVTNYKGETRFEQEHVANLVMVGYVHGASTKLALQQAREVYLIPHPILERFT